MNHNKSAVFVVNATALTSGGGLSILHQFIENIPPCQKNKYHIFISPHLSLPSVAENIHLIPMSINSFTARVIWDFWGLKRWCRTNGVVPNVVVSLQNTSIGYAHVPQVIYLHQGLSLYNKAWSFLKREEMTLAFYRYIYPWFIFAHAKPDTHFVVQTHWMKTVLCEAYQRSNSTVHVIKPDIWHNQTVEKPLLTLAQKYTLFYPANGHVYKNHQILFDALHEISLSGFDMSQIGLYLTVSPDKPMLSRLAALGLQTNVYFLGTLCYEDVLQYYQACTTVVFPSLIESFGLPLLEAAMLGKPVVAADLSYAKEVLNDYPHVMYADPESACAWKYALLSSFNMQETHPHVPQYDTNWGCFFHMISQLGV